MKVVLAGGYDTRNLGDHMALWGLWKALEEPQITLLTRHPGHYTSVPCIQIKNLDHASKEAARGRYFRGFNPGDSWDHLELIREAVAGSDALLIGGGRMLRDECYGVMRGPIPYFLELAKLARWLGKPVWLINNTYVLLDAHNKHARNEHRLLQDLADKEITRERTLGRIYAPDLAYSMVERGAERTLEGGFRLGIGVTRGQEELMVEVTQKAIERYKPDWVRFIPQMTYNVDTEDTDDRVTAQKVSERVKFGAIELLGEQDLSGLAKAYAGCDAVISARRHGVVMAACQGVPCMAVPVEKNVAFPAKYDMQIPIYEGSVDMDLSMDVRERCKELWDQSKEVYRGLKADL